MMGVYFAVGTEYLKVIQFNSRLRNISTC